MNYSRLKIWGFLSFTFAIIAIVIRAVWQITAFPTAHTMLIFVPLILALLGADALFAYLLIKPRKLRSRPFAIGVSAALTAGLLAGVTHFVRFIISPLADPFLSKVIAIFIVLSSISIYLLIVWFIWSLRKAPPG